MLLLLLLLLLLPMLVVVVLLLLLLLHLLLHAVLLPPMLLPPVLLLFVHVPLPLLPQLLVLQLLGWNTHVPCACEVCQSPCHPAAFQQPRRQLHVLLQLLHLLPLLCCNVLWQHAGQLLEVVMLTPCAAASLCHPVKPVPQLAPCATLQLCTRQLIAARTGAEAARHLRTTSRTLLSTGGLCPHKA